MFPWQVFWILIASLDPVLLYEKWMSSIVLLGPNEAIERRRQNPDHSYARRNVLISNRSCSHCSYLLLTYVVFTLSSLGSVHTTLDQFENAAFSLQLGLPSTLIRHDNNGFRKRYSKRRNLWTENTLEEEHVIPLACQILSLLMCFQIFPVKCRWGQDKRRSGPCVLFLDKKLRVQSPSFSPVY